jgi:hypothetical protein
MDNKKEKSTVVWNSTPRFMADIYDNIITQGYNFARGSV